MGPPARLAELVAAVSVATDMGTSLPVETGLAVCVTATRLAAQVGASGDDLAAVYYLALLRHIGCTAGSAKFAARMGDELVFGGRIGTADVTEPRVMAAVMMRHIFGDGVVTGVRRVGWLAAHPAEYIGEAAAVCEVAQRLTSRLGVGPLLHDGLAARHARYDGKAMSTRVPREEVPLASRVVDLSEVAVLAGRGGGMDGAVATVRARRGRALFPDLADVFCAAPGEFLPGDGEPLVGAVLGLEPGRAVMLDDEGLDEGLCALADFTDLKAPSLAGHSRAVAGLAAAAAEHCRLPAADIALTRRAGWVHDIGRITVSAGVWEKRGPLSRDEWERVRLHAYQTERVFDGLPSLRPIGAVAGLHHERGDGSGYHRAAAAGTLPPAARLLAAADVYAALVAGRPHRPALTADGAAAALRSEVRAGRLDSDAGEAVLAAAGHRVGRRRTAVAGLTSREVEVLAHVARGLSTKQIAAQLVLSPKTVDRHIESIYGKAGVRSRAAATLFAMQHDMVTPA